MSKKINSFAAVSILGACCLGWGGSSYAQSQTAPESRPDQSGMQTERDSRSSDAIIYRSTTIATDQSRLTTSVELPAGIEVKDNPAAREAIRDVFRTLVNAAAGGDMNKMVEQMSAPDRNRLESYASKVPEDFMSVVRNFGNLWETRFGSAFNILDREVFGPQYLAVATGEIGDPSALTNWPLEPLPGVSVPSGQGETSGLLGREYLTRGRDVAVVVLPASGNLPELTVSMTHEAPDFWKIDIPDNIDGPTLRANLERHINTMAASQNEWPPESTEGYRMAAHHVLMSVYDVGRATPSSVRSTGQGDSAPSPGASGSMTPSEGGATR